MPVGKKSRGTSPLIAPGEFVAFIAGEDGTAAGRRELLLGELARRMLADLEPPAVARSVVETLGRGLELDQCILFGLTEGALVMHSTGVFRAGTSDADPISLRGADELVAAIRREGELVAADVEAPGTDEAVKRLATALSARAVLAVPVMIAARVRSLLVLAANSNRHWKVEERLVARESSALIGTAQHQAELLDDARIVGNREQQLHLIGRALRSSLGLDHVLRTATERTAMSVLAERLTLMRIGSSGGVVPIWTFEAGAEPTTTRVTSPSRRSTLSSHLIDEFVSVRSALVLENSWDSPASANPATGEILPVLVCPIVVRNHLWGVFEVARPARTWSEPELSFVTEIAEQLATAVHQAELFDQVLRSKHEWETTFDGMADAVFIYDDRRLCRRTNRAAAEIVGKRLGELVDLPCCQIGLCTFDASCACESAIDSRTRVRFDLVSPRTYHPLHVTIDPIVGDNGDVIGAVQVVRDVEELRRTEAELKRQRQFLVNLVESAHEAIFVVDMEGRLVWSNSHLPAVVGHLVSELMGRPHSNVVAPEEAAICEQHFQAARLGETRRFEASFVHPKSGEERRITLMYAPIHEGDKVVSVLGMARDITEEKKIAERSAQVDKLRALGQLASGVAHDVNNDLAAILGRVQKLLRDPGFVMFHDELRIIETAALDSAQTVRRIQNFARQQGDADFAAVNLNGLVRDAIEITRTRWCDDAQSRGLRYSVEYEADGQATIYGNGSQVREVFVNLIINAIDAMPTGGSLRISSVVNEEGVIVRFADDGTGMPKHVRERIFEPFFTTKGASGTGMGLAVSYGIISLHGGTIDVETEPGHGTVFAIRLPLAKTTRDVPVVAPSTPVSPRRVLIIDDEPVVREVLVDLLEEQGHKAAAATSGAEGIAMLERSAVDVVFTDLAMPDMDGWAVARFVRQRWPGVKVVLVTGYGTSVTQPKDEPNLVDAVLGKPFEYEDIAAVLRRLGGDQ